MVHVDSYLFLSRHNIYYFRAIVPKDVGTGLHKREYRRSMQTRNLLVARGMARVLRVCFEAYIEGMRDDMAEWEQLRKLLDDTMADLLASEREKLRRTGPYPAVADEIWKNDVIPNYTKAIADISALRSKQQGGAVNAIPPFAKDLAERILQSVDIALDESSNLFTLFCEATVRMYLEFHHQRVELNDQARSFQVRTLQTLPIISLPAAENVNPGPLLSHMIETYCHEMVYGNNWTPKTELEYRAIYRVLISIINDRPINTVSSTEAKVFKEALMKLPSNMSKKPLYRDKPVKDVLAMKIPKSDLLSISKVNAYMSRVSSLFIWAVDNKHTQQNPFSGTKIKEKKPSHKKRNVFSDADLQALFDSSSYRSGRHLHPHYYWLPLLGLYTGARLDELCQLYLEDFQHAEGVWFITINDKRDKKLKNESSERLIPVHSHLLELGLLKYIELLKKKGDLRLFPELKKGRDGYSQAASKWFARYRERCGVVGSLTPFHSFRHTVLNHLKQSSVQEEKIAALAGHLNNSVTLDNYGKPYKAHPLVEAIEKLDFRLRCPALEALPKFH